MFTTRVVLNDPVCLLNISIFLVVVDTSFSITTVLSMSVQLGGSTLDSETVWSESFVYYKQFIDFQNWQLFINTRIYGLFLAPAEGFSCCFGPLKAIFAVQE